MGQREASQGRFRQGKSGLSGTRRSVIAGAGATLLATRARAGVWPERPVRLVHGFGVGGNADVIARIIAERLETRLGQAFVVEPRTGAGGRLAAAHLAKSEPDGGTIGILPGGHAIAAALYRTLPYGTVGDFTFVSMVTDFPFLIVTYPDHPVKTIAELIAAAKASPTPMTYGSAGNGTGQHLSGALFSAMAGIPMTHVPYRGGAPASNEIMGKHIDFLFETPTLLLKLVQAGQIRAVAVTGSSRFFALPDLPTIGETVSGYETSSWLGVAGPKGLPGDIVARLNSELEAIVQEPAVIEKFRALGNVPVSTTPDGFRNRVSADIDKWTKVAISANIEIQDGAQ